MPESRVNKRIALWANSNSNASCRSWFYSVKQKLTSLNLHNYCNILCPIVKYSVYEKMMSLYEHEWKQSINNVKGKSGKGRNKLRRYCTYKPIFCVEKYCLLKMPPKHRSALSKFRCGVAPIRIETGRYENLKENERVCPFCNCIEDEVHVLLYCNLYANVRQSLFDKAVSINSAFPTLNDDDKLSFILSNVSMARFSAKTCNDILNIRSFYLCK